MAPPRTSSSPPEHLVATQSRVWIPMEGLTLPRLSETAAQLDPPTLKLASDPVTRPCDNDSTHKPSAPAAKPSTSLATVSRLLASIVLAFADGHVDAARQTRWIAGTDTAPRRWNNDHEPHPETWVR